MRSARAWLTAVTVGLGGFHWFGSCSLQRFFLQAAGPRLVNAAGRVGQIAAMETYFIELLNALAEIKDY